MTVKVEGGNLLVDVGGVLNVLPLRGVPVWRKLLGLNSDVDAVAAMLTAQDSGQRDEDGNSPWALAWQALEEAALNEAGVEAPDPDAPGILPQDVEDGQGQSPVDEFIHGPQWVRQVAQLEAAESGQAAARVATVDEVEAKRQQARQMLGLEFAAETRAAVLAAGVARVPVFGQAARQALASEGVEPLESAAPMVEARAATLATAAASEPSLPLPEGVGAADIQAALTDAAEILAAAELDFDRGLLTEIWAVKNREPEPGPRTETERNCNES